MDSLAQYQMYDSTPLEYSLGIEFNVDPRRFSCTAGKRNTWSDT